MVSIDESKRLIPYAVALIVAEDVFQEMGEADTREGKIEMLAVHLCGVLDAHCILLQRGL